MKFIENKYTNWYNRIIYNASRRSLIKHDYTENHHVIPRSLGGSNYVENIIALTAREHFICHMLLPKMTEGHARIKMIHAAIGMKRSRKYQDRYINARLYESVRKEFATLASIRNKGKTLSKETRTKMSIAGKGRLKSEDHKNKISEANKGKSKGPMSDVVKKKIAESMSGRTSPNKGNKYQLTAAQRAKISEANRKRVVSDETKAKIAASLKARAHRNS